MKIKSLSILGFSAIIVFSFFGISDAKAAYDCAYNVTAAGLPACCYPAGSEPLEGISCRPEGQFLQKIGNNAPTCKDSAGLLNLASLAAAKNFIGFNCFSDSLNRTCQNPNTQCLNPVTDACQVFAGPNPICTAAHKTTNCDQSCGSCSSGYISCSGTCQTPAVGTCTGGYTWDQCTGTCSCPEGTTPSGLTANTCISYFSRFAEILSYGLAVLGGPAKNGVYDYSVTNPIDYMRNVYLKSDVAESPYWNSETLPPFIKNLINNNGSNSYYLCGPNSSGIVKSCPAGMTCSDGGLCYTPSGTVGTVCTNTSKCNLGLMCDSTGHCSNPNFGLNQCVTDADCSSGQICGFDHYCHTLTGGSGYSCTSDTSCAEGYFCNNNSPRACEKIARLSYFVGTTANFNGSQGGYKSANSKCEQAFTGSHICSGNEMINSFTYQASSAPVNLATGKAWINNGAPGYMWTLSNDCGGWSTSIYSQYGSIWDFTGAIKQSRILNCVNSIPFACCR